MARLQKYRSILYVPSLNKKALDKCIGGSLPAIPDAVICDLEDAVSFAKKDEARNILFDALKQGIQRQPVEVPTQQKKQKSLVTVRINGPSTKWFKDDCRMIKELISSKEATPIEALVIPKVERVEEVISVMKEINGVYSAELVQNFALSVWCMIETPIGILHARSIASIPKVEALVMGSEDLSNCLQSASISSSSLSAQEKRNLLQYSKSSLIVAARAEGKFSFDGIFAGIPEVANPDQSSSSENKILKEFEEDSRYGLSLGFDGKTLIHPNQIHSANKIFGVTEDDYIKAKRIIEAWTNINADNVGVCVVDGKMVERLHVERAKRVIVLYE